MMGVVALGATSCAKASHSEPDARLQVRPVGRYNVHGGSHPDPRLAAVELSGLAWMGGDRYASVTDEYATLHFLSIPIDRTTGTVTGLEFVGPKPLYDDAGARLGRRDGGPDLEGIAFESESGTFWIADERSARDSTGSALRRHDREGRTLEVVGPSAHPSLAPFASTRSNRGLESLARRPDDGGYWTANEESLLIDGPTATPERGTVVRLFSFDASMRPEAQYAYRTDPVSGTISSPTTAVGHELSGVVGLTAVPGGRLLALERMLGGDESGMAGFRIRIYEIDASEATDVSAEGYRDGLEGTEYVPVAKRLLAEQRFGLANSNFEGMALGPELENGDRSLLIVADNGGGDRQSVYAFRISGIDASSR